MSRGFVCILGCGFFSFSWKWSPFLNRKHSVSVLPDFLVLLLLHLGTVIKCGKGYYFKEVLQDPIWSDYQESSCESSCEGTDQVNFSWKISSLVWICRLRYISFLICLHLNVLILCVSEWVCVKECVCIYKVQRTTCGSEFFSFHDVDPRGLNLGPQAWQQAFWSTEFSQWPTACIWTLTFLFSGLYSHFILLAYISS